MPLTEAREQRLKLQPKPRGAKAGALALHTPGHNVAQHIIVRSCKCQPYLVEGVAWVFLGSLRKHYQLTVQP